MCNSTSPAVLLVEMMMMTVAVVRLCQCDNAVDGDGDDGDDSGDRRHGDILLCQLVSADTHTLSWLKCECDG